MSMMRTRIAGGVIGLTILVAAPAHAQTGAAPAPAPSGATPEPAGRKCHEVTELKSKPSEANWWRSTWTTDWSGACVNGVAQGFGRFTRSENGASAFGTNTSSSVDEGMLVDGGPVGMWCNISFVSDSTMTIANQTTTIHTDKHRPCTIARGGDGYAHIFGWRHDPDGSWSVIEIGMAGLNAPLTVSAGEMETLLAKIAKDPKTFPDFPFSTSLLDGLLPGGAATSLGNMGKPIDVGGKRVALVLSSRTVTELARWGKQRDAFVKSNGYGKKFGGQGYTMDGDRYDDSFAGHVASTDPGGLVPAVIAALQPAFGADTQIIAADDLGVLANGQADYAIVIDWSFDGGLLSPSQFEKMPPCDLAKNEALCAPMFKDHWAAMVIDAKIRVAAIVTAEIGEVKRYGKELYYDTVVRDIGQHLWRLDSNTNITRIATQLGGRLPWTRLEPLIMRYLRGDGVKKNTTRAQELLNEAMQQKQPAAYRISADFLRSLPGVDMVSSVLPSYQQGAELGDIESMIQLSYLYSNGAEGVPRDTAAAAKYIAMAYAARKTDHTTYNMGLAKAYGWGGPIDLPEALKLFEAAQALGHPQAVAEAAKVRAQLNTPTPR